MNSTRNPLLDGSCQTLTGESLALGLLGKVIYSYPDRPWLQSLADEGVFEEVPFADSQADVIAGMALLNGWSESSRGGMSDEAFDSLRADYTRLFVGPGRVLAAPWESVYFSDQRVVFQERTLFVREWYARFGLQAERLYIEPDDHIGLELTFVAHLAGLTASAWERGEQEECERLVEAQAEFVGEHILRWGRTWCDQVMEHSGSEFYRGIALVTRGVLAELAAIHGSESTPLSNSCPLKEQSYAQCGPTCPPLCGLGF